MIGLLNRDRDTNKRIQQGAILVFILGGIALAVYGYMRYMIHQQQKAQLFFADSFEEFRTALRTNQSHQWAEVEKAFKSSYAQASKSTLAPYFLAFESEAYLQQGNKEHGQELLKQALQLMRQEAPFYHVYALKQALIKLDNPEQKIIDEGLGELKQLAHNPQNIYRDMALYYLGSFLAFKGEERQAQAVFKELQQVSPVSSQLGSPWAQV